MHSANKKPSIFTRIRKTIADITPYIFCKENAYRLGGGFTLIGVGMSLDLAISWAVGETYAMFASGFLSTTILGIEAGPYATIAMGTTAYMLSGQVINKRNAILTPIAPHAVKELETECTRRYVYRSLEEQLKSKEGEDVVRMQKGYTAAESVSSLLLTQITPTLAETIFTAGMSAWWYGAEFGLGLTGVVLVSAIYHVRTTEKNVKLRNETLQASNKSYDDLMRPIENARTIQSNNNEEVEIKRVWDSHHIWANAESKSNVYIYEVTRKQDFIISAGFMILTFLAGRSVLNQEITGQDFATLTTLLLRLLAQIGYFGHAASEIVSALGDLEAVFKDLETPSKIPDPHPEKELIIPEGGRAEVEFKNVSLTFENGKQALNNVSFVAPAGKKTVIVGESGAGKSTIANLLERFYDPTSGEVCINNQNIKNFGLKKIRALMGLVEQKPVLPCRTIKENIAYGIESYPGGAKQEEIVNAAKKACLEPFIESLPEKYDTEIGRAGGKLSGGQAQRVVIARALIRNPYILLFDEATSALDNETQKNLQMEIDTIMDVTKIMITHRLYDAVNADKIVVLKKGQIVEEGTHYDLLEKNGEYARLWYAQQHDLEEKAEPAPLSRELKNALSYQPPAPKLSVSNRSSMHSSQPVFFHSDRKLNCPEVKINIERKRNHGF